MPRNDWSGIITPKNRFRNKKKVDPRRALADNTPCSGIPPQHPIAHRRKLGAIAQLGERLLCKQEVVGSIPSGSTNFLHLYQLGMRRFAVTEWLCVIMANDVYLVSANQPKPCAWAKITHWQARE
jgi:hypothetical protein